MFTIQIDDQAQILERLLKVNVEPTAKIIDFTYGNGGLWNFKHTYDVVKCDKDPGKVGIKKDLCTDDYYDLGMFQAGVFDPPYLIGRMSFDYPLSNSNRSQTFQGPEGFTEKHVSNQSVEQFNARTAALNVKAAQCIEEGGRLLVKVMDPRHKKKLVPHHINIVNAMTNFQLTDIGVYVRQGATTWRVDKGLQNLHGYWLCFQRPLPPKSKKEDKDLYKYSQISKEELENLLS